MRWLVVLVAFLGLQAHGLAQATDEPARKAAPTLSLAPSQGRPGSTVKASGKGYCGSVILRWDGKVQLKSGKSDKNGKILITFTVPKGATPGQYTVTSTSECGRARASFKVVEPRAVRSHRHQPAPPPAPPPAPASEPEEPDGYKGNTKVQFDDIHERETEPGAGFDNCPGHMQVGVANRVEMLITRKELDELAKVLREKSGRPIEVLEVGTKMQVKLEGGAFDIKLIGGDIQYLGSADVHRWRWDVTPTVSGIHLLDFTILVLYGEYEDIANNHSYPACQVNVTASPGYSLSKWLPNNWEKLIATLAVIIGIIEGCRRLRLKRTDDRSDGVALGRGRELRNIRGRRRVGNRP